MAFVSLEAANPEGLGEILRAARVAKGLSQSSLAHDLRMPIHLLAAIESDDWQQLPPGRERPLARRIALHLELDLATCPEAWEQVPGAVTTEPHNPKRERIERILTGALTLGSIALLIWLVVPGRDIKGSAPRQEPRSTPDSGSAWSLKTPTSAYPVLGEVLPEAPINADGILMNLRAMDTCIGRIESEGKTTVHTLRVSEPWTLRVKGPFTLSLDNAGVVTAEIAGRRVPHGGAVGEAWVGRFDEEGQWVRPIEPKPQVPLHIPQSESPIEE